MDLGEAALALGAWERALDAYLAASKAVLARGALAGAPDPLDLDLLESLQWEQQEALLRYLAACRVD